MHGVIRAVDNILRSRKLVSQYNVTIHYHVTLGLVIYIYRNFITRSVRKNCRSLYTRKFHVLC